MSNAVKKLCLNLMHAEREEDVINLLKEAGYWDRPECWRLYGDKELNWSQAGGQQGRSDFALNEKIINSIDSFLTLKCLLAGINPESPKAPTSIREAVAKFIEGAAKLTTSGGRVEDWASSFATKVAENISVFATEPPGSPRGTKPCINIADLGEGHTPDAFPTTFVSLGEKNKVSIQFVQGKFCQGGSGAIRHCGQDKLQLVVSRRHPDLLDSDAVSKKYPKGNDDDCWGFTIVRRVPADESSFKIPTLIYLAPVGANDAPKKGQVLRFRADEMPIFPERDTAYKRNVPYGTLIKLYEYQLKTTGNIVLDLLYKMDLLLPDPALPIRMHECRPDRRGKTTKDQVTTMSGIFSRLKGSDNIEQIEPAAVPITVAGKQLIARIFAFKPKKSSQYRQTEGVLLTVNGQTHSVDIKTGFFAAQRIGLQRIAKDLLVVVDCSQLDVNQRDELFMTSRDRVAEASDIFKDLKENLADALKNHEGLRALRNRRAQEEVDEKLKDDKPLENVLKQVLKTAPTLARFFGSGEKIQTRHKPNNIKKTNDLALKEHPSFFHFWGKEEGVVLNRTAHLKQKCRIAFATDVKNDYFTRKYDPGIFQFFQLQNSEKQALKSFVGPALFDGKCNLSFELPESSEVGDVLKYEVVVRDEVTQREFINRIVLTVAAEQEKKEPGKTNPKTGGIAFPKYDWVGQERKKDKWEEFFNDDLGCLTVIDDGEEINGKWEPNYHFYLNEENKHLRSELMQTKGSMELLKKKYEIAAILVGLALLQEAEDQKKNSKSEETSNAEEEELEARIQNISKALAPILIPMIDGLGGIDASILSEELSEAA